MGYEVVELWICGFVDVLIYVVVKLLSCDVVYS